MKLKKLILFLLIGMFSLSFCLPVNAGDRYAHHYKTAAKKVAKLKNKKKTSNKKAKAPLARKTKRNIFPFA